MALIVTHAKVATLPDQSGAEINKEEWNTQHSIAGNLDVTNINSGVGATASTFLRGDMTWAAITGGSGTVLSVNIAGANGISVAGSGYTITGTVSLSIPTLSTGQITSAGIATAFTITANAISVTNTVTADSVTAGSIAAITITAVNISASSIVGNTITAINISAASIGAGTITAVRITAANIAATTISAVNISAASVGATTITAVNISAASIGAGTITAVRITSENIAATTISAVNISAASVGATTITAVNISAASIGAGTITAVRITAANIAATTISSVNISAASVGATTITCVNITCASIGAVTITSVNISVGGTLTAAGMLATGTRGIGYATGAGGTVSQATSKATAVTLNKTCGLITCTNTVLSAGVIVTFAVNNTTVTNTDVVLCYHDSVGTLGAYDVFPNTVTANAFSITLRNNSVTNLAEAIGLRFSVVKGAIA